MIDYNTILEDDETDEGGVAFLGETLGDFLASVGLEKETDINKINSVLKDCGIKPIKEVEE